jgi:2'-5' RNA ligase
VGRLIGVLKKKSKSHAIRWTKIENLHITLQFLAEVKTEHLSSLIEHVRSQVEGVLNSTSIAFGQIHLFPNPFRPRVIVLDIVPQEELARMSELIGQGIKLTGYEIENRPFRAHLTLGRIKQPQDVDLGFLSEKNTLPQLESVDVREVALFRSEPQSDGSTYSVLEKITLEKKLVLS